MRFVVLLISLLLAAPAVAHAGVTKAWPHPAAPKASKPSDELQRELARAVGPLDRGSGLRLVRSYEVAEGNRLAEWAWTYDSGITGAAFVAAGERAQARQVLDQLAELQRADGGLAFAHHVRTGDASPLVRAGAVAWIATAFVAYDRTFADDRYESEARRAADFLLDLRGPHGLVRGGPDVRWAATEHNVLAYTLLGNLAERLQATGGDAGRYRAEADALGAAMERELVVSGPDGAWIRQGQGDDVRALDAQALGAVFLAGRGRQAEAEAVLDGAERDFARPGGYVPYAAPGAPEVLWFEGLGEMRAARAALGLDTAGLDAAMERWWAPARAAGELPHQADRASDGRFGEFHPRPAAAAGAWMVLSRARGDRLLVRQAP